MQWKFEIRKIEKIKPWAKNPRKLSEKGLNDLFQSIKKFGIPEPIIINTDGTIIGGHARYLILKKQNQKNILCAIPTKKLNQKEFEELNIRLNKNIAGEFDFDILNNEFNINDLINWGFDPIQFKINTDIIKETEIDIENLNLENECPSGKC